MQTNNLMSSFTAGVAAVGAASVVLALINGIGLSGGFDPGTEFVAIATRLGSAPLPASFGWIIYVFVGAFFWSLVYAAIEPQLPGAPAIKGAMFGAALAIVILALLAPLAGRGFFALGSGAAFIVPVLLLHIVYGIVLALVYASQSGSAAVDDVTPG